MGLGPKNLSAVRGRVLRWRVGATLKLPFHTNSAMFHVEHPLVISEPSVRPKVLGHGTGGGASLGSPEPARPGVRFALYPNRWGEDLGPRAGGGARTERVAPDTSRCGSVHAFGQDSRSTAAREASAPPLPSGPWTL